MKVLGVVVLEKVCVPSHKPCPAGCFYLAVPELYFYSKLVI